MIQLKRYQQEAVERLYSNTENLSRSSENEICIFQAPTGSGKTLMVAEFLKKLVKENEQQEKLSFVWISVRKLHSQSKDKLDEYYEKDRLLKCSYFEDLEDKRIDENEILFINWHSINKKDINIYVKENEQDNNLNSIIKKTKEEGRKIIMIIDESHHTATSTKSRELVETISPKVTIEVSATPHLRQNAGGIVKVNLNDVKEEGMIKTEVSINPEFKGKKVEGKTSDELVIQSALLKRKTLQYLFKKVGGNINPLVLIQLPDNKKGMQNKLANVKSILEDKFDICEENGRLAIWISGKHSDTLTNIEKNNDKTEVLLFKQAPALGWDCPRATILVLFRESKSFVFTIQTIGRIMRMPELKHYDQEELNKGFVFTNLSNIRITEDYAKDYITINESKRRNKIYNNISLPSVYLKRQRERTRLSGDFVRIFNELAVQSELRYKLKIPPSKIVNPVISDGKISDIDKEGDIQHKGWLDIELTELEIQNMFDDFIRSSCKPFAPVDSSDRMKTALYQFCKNQLDVERYSLEAQKIVLGKENYSHFIEIIILAKEKYKTKVIEQLEEKRDVQLEPNWEVPIIISYNSKYKPNSYKKSIMTPLYLLNSSKVEQCFMKTLDNSSNVKWWFRNREAEAKYFAVLYEDKNGFKRSFYIDFIVMSKDGRIGLFDTKSGITAENAQLKARGLQKYIKEQKAKGKRVWGGIVIPQNGAFLYNDSEQYNFDSKKLDDNWKPAPF